MRLGGMRGGHSSRPSNLGIDSRDMGLFDPGGSFNPLTIPNVTHLYWVDGPEMIAKAYTDTALVNNIPDEFATQDMTQGTDFRKPTYDLASPVANLKPALRSLDANRLIAGNFPAAVSQPFEVVVIGRIPNDGVIWEGNIGTLSRGSGAWHINFGTDISGGVADDNIHMFRVRTEAGTNIDKLFVDEVEVISGNAGGNTVDRSQIFNDRFATAGIADATITFVAFANPVLAAVDIAALYQWAQSYYSVNQPVVGPYGVAALSKVWFKADSITGKNDGDAISQWNDLSGFNNHLLQATGTKQPLFKTNIINGLSVVRFDGVDDFMASAAVPTNVTDNWTMAAILKDIGVTNGRAPFFNGAGNGNGYGISTRTSGGKKGYLRGGIAWHDSTVNPDLAATVYVLQRVAGTTNLYINGGAAVMTTASGPFGPSSYIRAGDHDPAAPAPWNGDMLEGLLFNKALSKANLNTMGAALAARAGTVWTNIP